MGSSTVRSIHVEYMWETQSQDLYDSEDELDERVHTHVNTHTREHTPSKGDLDEWVHTLYH